jgi:hypothetical protein
MPAPSTQPYHPKNVSQHVFRLKNENVSISVTTSIFRVFEIVF